MPEPGTSLRSTLDHGNIGLHVVTFLIWTLGVAATTWLICTKYTKKSQNASDDYFAGGRSLKWYIVAGSLMLTNLSTEQLVGLNGAIFKDGCLSGIWWEAGASIAMIVTATVFLPRYMALGLTTTSGFLGKRFDQTLRTLVSVIFLLYYAAVLCPLVLYTGAMAIRDIFELDNVPLWVVSSVIGAIGATYALFGGLKAVAVSDCLNGVGLIVVGLWIPIAALSHLPNGISSLFSEPDLLKPLVARSHVYDDETKARVIGIPSVPWHVTLTGMALANMYYWSTNQVIVQRVLAAESLAQGQKGVLFAATMKVVGFSFLCLPGIIGILMVKEGGLVNGEPFTVRTPDEVYPELVKAVMPTWSLGLFSAVLLGSVLSTFNSALNSASTMFGLEIYRVYLNKEATDQRVVFVSTIFGASLTLLSFVIAPQLDGVGGIFGFLQHMNSVVSLPILTVFFIGMAASLPDAFAAKVGFAGALVSGCASQWLPDIHFLHIFFICFAFGVFCMLMATYLPSFRRIFGVEPRPTPYEAPDGCAKVDIAEWAYLRRTALSIVTVLTLLIVALQAGRVWMFYGFWAVWFVVLVALIVHPSSKQIVRKPWLPQKTADVHQEDPASKVEKNIAENVAEDDGNNLPTLDPALEPTYVVDV